MTILEENGGSRTCCVGVSGNRICYIGTEKPDTDYGKVLQAGGSLLLPGLVNAHGHAPMSLLRGYAENMKLQDWLEKRVFPFEAQMEERDIYAGAMLSFAEMLRFGTVSTSEMYFSGRALFRAFCDSGIKGNIGVPFTADRDVPLEEHPVYREIRELESMIEARNDDQIRMDLSIHAEYSSIPNLVRQLADYNKEKKLSVHLHASETRTEVEDCRKRHGMSPIRYFEENGIFDFPALAAHCVWLTEDDRRILAKHKVTAVTCPVSNLKLASGICRVSKLLERGVPVAIGTDGPASNNSLNLWSDLKTMALLSKVSEDDPSAITPQQALAIATVNGAAAQQRYDCGCIRVGEKADLVLVDLDTPWMNPSHSLWNHMLYSMQGSDVELTMVDGKILYENGEYPLMDIEHVIYEAKASAASILRKLG